MTKHNAELVSAAELCRRMPEFRNRNQVTRLAINRVIPCVKLERGLRRRVTYLFSVAEVQAVLDRKYQPAR